MKQKITKKIKSFLQLFQFCISASYKASKKYCLINILFIIAETILPLILLYISKIITDCLVSAISIQGDKIEYIRGFIFASIAIAVIQIISKIIYSMKNYTENMQRDTIAQYLNNVIMEKAATLDLKYFDSVEYYNELMDTSNNKFILSQVTMISFYLIKFAIQSIIAAIYIINLNWKFAFLLILTAIPMIISNNKLYIETYFFQRGRMSFERKIYYLYNLCTDKYFAKDIKFFNLGSAIKNKHNMMWKKLFSDKSKLVFKYSAIGSFFSALPEIIILGFLISIGLAIINGQNTVGDYSLYYGLIYQFIGALSMITLYLGQLSEGMAKIENMISFLNWENENSSDGEIILDSQKNFTIEFKNVSFSYKENSKRVLNNINFKISSSQKIAFVGVNGSGKSTLIKLLLRFYDPTEGVILINEIDLKKYNLQSIRKCFAILFQDYCNYAFTVTENVALEEVNQSINQEKVEMALKKSGAWKFVSKFDDRMESYLTTNYEENGKELSGGQWQKIALSRTFYRDSKMIILDEPSSSLDPEAEYELFQKFTELYENKGAIMISHRLANITFADCIINIENGEIIEMGTHVELMKQNKRYAYLYKLQANQYNN